MFSNADNSNIEINVGKGGNGMSDGTISIGISEYKQILELAYKSAMLKEAVLNCASFDCYSNGLYFGNCKELNTILKYAFPAEYESRLRELKDKEKEEEGADDER